MSKLNIDQQTIKELFSNKRSDFLIPDYQRPYAWEETECQTLWDDIFAFAFPENDYSLFKSDEDEYFLGPIVTFKNTDGKLEIIDGQQRLTTLMLLLRAFFAKFGDMQDSNSKSTSEDIAKCIWKTDEFGNPDKNKLKIDSEVSSDDDKEEFLSILKNGKVAAGQKSRYAKTYMFFEEKINDFLQHFPTYFAYLPTRILNNCILLPIEAESQDTALRIFSTLNDRGKPLSDTDIFKAQFYKYYSDKGQKDIFIQRWKELEALCEDVFTASSGSPMDELFTRYMYYERAKQNNKQTTTEALRKFYEKDKYAILKRDDTFVNLERLAAFWKSIASQDDAVFSEKILKRLSVLNNAPNGMWTYLLSVYFMKYSDEEGKLDEEKLYVFLNRIIAFIWTYAVMRPGVNALRTPSYPAMIDIVNGKEVDFADFKFDTAQVRNMLTNYEFTNQRPITRSMLAWWAYNDDGQQLISNDTTLEIEHIYPKQRQINEKALSDKNSLESLGNKALLEKGINIRASDYRFEDKKKYYLGFTNDKGKTKAGTINHELTDMAKKRSDFQEADIKDRKKAIIDDFIQYVVDNGLSQ
ncbi:MAG: DUF262 domain-containing protein [Lachnospiraceae bacterium]|nr:DUF262 domain-containing protein [Lachnospiraceae bacterium]